MSNLRSDCLDLVKDRPAGDVWRTHIELLCAQIDTVEASWHESERNLKELYKTIESEREREREYYENDGSERCE